MTKSCILDDCDQPRHLTATGRADPTMYAAHDRMLRVLQDELRGTLPGSRGASMGALNDPR